MSNFQERIKSFSQLPALKSQLGELKLKLESLEKIKNNVSNENYLTLSSSSQKQIDELMPKIDELQAGIAALKNEIELDSTVLESENSIVEKEINEQQFLLERGALSKQEYNSKRSLLQNKISRNKNLLSKNQSNLKELDFYSTHVGVEKYGGNSFSKQLGSLSESGNTFRGLILKIPSILKSKVFISVASGLIILFVVIKIFGSEGTVKIGDQIWATENLDVDHYQNGDPIPEVQDKEEWKELETGAWCYYDNDSKNGKDYGKLYNWYAVNDPRGLAPEGWRIPLKEDWKILVEFLGEIEIAGNKMKETGTDHWKRPNKGATNESGFAAMPAGMRIPDYMGEGFSLIGDGTAWWTTYESNGSKAMCVILLNDEKGPQDEKLEKKIGLSIRCIKNN